MDYPSLKAKADRQWDFLEKLPQPLITIGMGTCGIAAGAQEVLDAAKQALKRMNLLGHILYVGCIGM